MRNSFVRTPTNTDLLSKKISEIRKYEPKILYLDEFSEWLTAATDEELFLIELHDLSVHWGKPTEELVPIFLMATRTGILDMHWDVHCPMCDGIPSRNDSVRTLTALGYCPACDHSFDNAADHNIQVRFTINDNLRPIGWPTSAHNHHHRSVKRLTAMDLLLSPVYRRYFSHDVLSDNESLIVRHVAIMFTDIKSSTALYRELGDTEAYKKVKNHFKILEDEINQHRGVIVKTIGDSVMASFGTTAQAVKAAVAVQRRFKEFSVVLSQKKEILIRVGIHVGPAIVVTLNNQLDYFGTTVNVAARIESTGDGRDILISKAVYDDLGVRHELLKAARAIVPFKTSLKGIGEDQPVLKIQYD